MAIAQEVFIVGV